MRSRRGTHIGLLCFRKKVKRFGAAFAADAAGFHAAEASARMSFRSEAFTFRDVGKTFATSESKTMTFVPSE
jgi:hypothetical protein